MPRGEVLAVADQMRGIAQRELRILDTAFAAIAPERVASHRP